MTLRDRTIVRGPEVSLNRATAISSKIPAALLVEKVRRFLTFFLTGREPDDRNASEAVLSYRVTSFDRIDDLERPGC